MMLELDYILKKCKDCAETKPAISVASKIRKEKMRRQKSPVRISDGISIRFATSKRQYRQYNPAGRARRFFSCTR